MLLCQLVLLAVQNARDGEGWMDFVSEAAKGACRRGRAHFTVHMLGTGSVGGGFYYRLGRLDLAKLSLTLHYVTSPFFCPSTCQYFRAPYNPYGTCECEL
jgi:hypothetical protein